jgi:uncharacterized protein YdhG (YjbR/CyaY superfamily)
MPPDVATYIEGFGEPARSKLLQIRALVLDLVPDAEEAIKYRMPTVIWKGNLLHYAAFSKHIGLYPLPTVLEAFRIQLEPYVHGKGSVQFPLDQELPVDLIRRMVEFRIQEAMQKAASKGKGHKPD